MRKIQLGAGTLHIPGWENYDDAAAIDITKRLPFEDDSVDVVFSEMCLEHITPKEAWYFLEECFRILKRDGLVRMTIPDFPRCLRLKNPRWLEVNKGVTGNDGTIKDQMKSIIVAHGHQGLWSSELLKAVMEAIGFVCVTIKEAGQSDYEVLRNVEQHHHSVGPEVAWAESGCVEGAKP